MSYRIFPYRCAEVIVDDNGDTVEEVEIDLPHDQLIKQAFCTQFNQASFLLDVLNKEVDGKIDRLVAKPFTTHNQTTVVGIYVYGKPGIRFTAHLEDLVGDFLIAQYSDGWGEGFFGVIITAPDGTRFFID